MPLDYPAQGFTKQALGIADSILPLTAAQLPDAWAELLIRRARTWDEMRSYADLLCPVSSIPAFRHSERKWNIEGQTDEYLDAVRHTQCFHAPAAPAAVVLDHFP